jgi:shikimate kinase
MKVAGNIFLVGLMGAGKTTVGKLLAKSLGKSFYDSDHEIEQRTGVKVPLIFELEGEAGFRKREAQAITELTNLHDVILATGGGAILMPENRQVLSSRGLVIYLRATVDELCHRTRGDRNRPLLQTENPREHLQKLYMQRDPLYLEVADMVVDTGGQPVGMIVSQIERNLTCKHST